MYSAPYGFPNAAAFSTPTPPQNPHLQPGPSPGQPQQMMYNPQFPVGAQGAFPGGPGAMMPGAGNAGMMQNTAMPHMGANGQMTYQTPYTGSPYGAGTPSSTAPQPQLPPNFNMMAGSMPGFPMGAGGMPQAHQQQQQQQQHQQQQQQQMMQRMHPSQQNAAAMGVSTPQRQFSGPQSGPGNSTPSQQRQFSTPQGSQGAPTPDAMRQQQQHQQQAQHQHQHQHQQHHQHQHHPSQQSGSAISTPQTPTFPSSAQGAVVNGGSTASTPLSPGTGTREKELFSLLLDINQELLYELVQLQYTQQEVKKDEAATAGGDGKANEHPKEQAEEIKLLQVDYAQCIRWLNTNLAYMACLADRKGTVQVPKGPLYLLPPPLNLNLKIRAQPLPSDSSEPRPDPSVDREERDKYLKELYKRLQALFPGVDPEKEPAFPLPAQNQGMPGGAQGQGQNPRPQGPTQASPPPPPSNQRTLQMANASATPPLQSTATF